MKILVTGHNGFIGKNLCLYLRSKGLTVEGYEYDSYKLPSISKFDCVMHLGAISSTTEKDVDLVMNRNYDFSRWIFKECKKYKIKLQYASSASVYGTGTNFSENAPKQPQSPYAWSKYLFDRWVSNQDYENLVQGLRYFNVYGPHEGHKEDQSSPIHKFTNQAKSIGSISLFENSDKYVRDFVCVQDVCRVHYKLLQHNKSDIFNVGTGSPVSFQHVANLIAKKYNSDINYIKMPDNLKGQYQEYTCANIDKLTSAIDINFRTIEEYLNGQNN